MDTDQQQGVRNPLKGHTKEEKVGGILLPPLYRRHYFYRNHFLFRLSFVLIILCVISVVASVFTYYRIEELRNNTKSLSKLINEEALFIERKKLEFKSLRDKYTELEMIENQIRIPVSPILDAIEKTINTNISLNRLSIQCEPTATEGTQRREMTLSMEVFFPEGVDTEDKGIEDWPMVLGNEVSKWKMEVKDFFWGPSVAYKSPLRGQGGTVLGKTRQLTLLIQFQTGL